MAQCTCNKIPCGDLSVLKYFACNPINYEGNFARACDQPTTNALPSSTSTYSTLHLSTSSASSARAHVWEVCVHVRGQRAASVVSYVSRQLYVRAYHGMGSVLEGRMRGKCRPAEISHIRPDSPCSWHAFQILCNWMDVPVARYASCMCRGGLDSTHFGSAANWMMQRRVLLYSPVTTTWGA